MATSRREIVSTLEGVISALGSLQLSPKPSSATSSLNALRAPSPRTQAHVWRRKHWSGVLGGPIHVSLALGYWPGWGGHFPLVIEGCIFSSEPLSLAIGMSLPDWRPRPSGLRTSWHPARCLGRGWWGCRGRPCQVWSRTQVSIEFLKCNQRAGSRELMAVLNFAFLQAHHYGN